MPNPAQMIRRKSRAAQPAQSPRTLATAGREASKPRPRRCLNEAAHKLYR